MNDITIEVGELLKRTRLNFGYNISDIEYNLNIRANQIEAIERGDLSQLPGKVYAIGFVRSYANYLDLNANEIVNVFKAQYIGSTSKSKLLYPEIISYKKIPHINIVIISLILSGLFAFAWHKSNKTESLSGLKINPIPENIKYHLKKDILATSNINDKINIDLDKPEITDGIEDMGNAKADKSGVMLNIIDSSWVEIKNSDGKIIISNILEKGDEYFVPDSPGLTMSLGNAANVEITIDGQVLMPLGKDGDVRRDIPLDSSYLKTLKFKESLE